MPRPYSLILFFLLRNILSAQPAEVELSSTIVRTNSPVLLFLSVTSSPEAPVAALQWNLEYDSSTISDISVENGPAAAAGGKTVICAKNERGCACLAFGLDATAVPDGIVARIAPTLAPGIRTAAILVTNAMAASASGGAIPVTSTNGSVTVAMRPLLPPNRQLPPKEVSKQ